MELVRYALAAGWFSMLGGAISGMYMGLRFHRDGWLGGYGSWPRRMVRLGHIAFFGLGSLNLLFALSVRAQPIPAPLADIAAAGFIVGALTMPLACFLAAWRATLRHLFPIPVAGIVTGITALLAGWGLL